MFRSNLFYSLIIVVFCGTFFSCEREDAFTDGTELSDKITPVLGFPERVPADAYLNNLMMSGETDWQLYDTYYRNELLNQGDAEFFNNLQWSTVAHLVTNTNFLKSAPQSTQAYYLEEILKRDYINKPAVVVSLLREQQINGVEDHKLASVAREVLSKNKAHLSEDNFKKHQARNQEAFKELFDLGYDRWGKEK
jgi:hypothetical protein